MAALANASSYLGGLMAGIRFYLLQQNAHTSKGTKLWQVMMLKNITDVIYELFEYFCNVFKVLSCLRNIKKL